MVIYLLKLWKDTVAYVTKKCRICNYETAAYALCNRLLMRAYICGRFIVSYANVSVFGQICGGFHSYMWIVFTYVCISGLFCIKTAWVHYFQSAYLRKYADLLYISFQNAYMQPLNICIRGNSSGYTRILTFPFK